MLMKYNLAKFNSKVPIGFHIIVHYIPLYFLRRATPE